MRGLCFLSPLWKPSAPRPHLTSVLTSNNQFHPICVKTQSETHHKKKKNFLTKKLKWRCQLLSVMLIFIGFIKSTYLSFLHSFIQPLFIDLPRILTLRGSSDLLVERRLREKERSIHSLLSPIPRTSCSLEITLYSRPLNNAGSNRSSSHIGRFFSSHKTEDINLQYW